MRHALSATMLTAVALAALSPAAQARVTHFVDDDGAQCAGAVFSTIQAAVDAAGPRDNVFVCDGSYQEQVTIDGAGKSGLRLRARTLRGAAIQAPAGRDIHGIVRVTGGALDVEVSRFVIERVESSGPTYVGVAVDGGASLRTMRHNVIQGLMHSAAVGVFINGGRAHDISHNTIVDAGGVGIRVGPPSDSFARMSLNTVRGASAFGILITDMAGGLAIGNRVSGASIAGIGVTHALRTREVVAKNNQVLENHIGVFVQVSQGARIAHNNMHRNRSFGILVDQNSSGNRLHHNDARFNGADGCRDDSSGAGTAGTANTWIANRGTDPFSSPGLCRP